RATSIVYDEEDLFPYRVTNALGHTTSVDFDARWGRPTKVVDANGIAARYAYDALGVMVEAEGPTGTTLWGFQDGAGLADTLFPNQVTLRVNTQHRGREGTATGGTSQDYDSYGRLVRPIAAGFNGAEVLQEVRYSSLGQAPEQTLPYAAGATGLEIPKAKYRYEYLERLQEMENPDGSVAKTHHAACTSLAMDDRPPPFDDEYIHSDIQLSIDEESRRNLVLLDDQGRPVRTYDGNNVTMGEGVDWE